MDKVKDPLLSGKVDVVDASYFDLLPRRQLLRPVTQTVSDGSDCA